MKKLVILFLVLVLLAVPVAASGYFVVDNSGLLSDSDAAQLEELYSTYPVTHGFTAAVVTVDSFDGLSAEEFAGAFYDAQGYLEDGVLLLVSLAEGEWYILTNGECYNRISDWDAENIGEVLVPLIQDGRYSDAFRRFPEMAARVFETNVPEDSRDEDMSVAPAVPKKNYAKTVAISMAVGLGIGLITVGIMSISMKSVKQKSGASDYIRPGSMRLTNSRDIFLYSRVTRTPKPKNNSSSGGGSGGGSRGGAGGRL